MNPSINLIFGCHSHQPVGNFENVFADAYAKAYLPFVEVLERFPDVHVTFHYSGPLFDWYKQHRPEYLKRLAALVQKGQIEIMGGGYYEPLLCAIPERDAIDQIERMSDFCEEHFGKRPRGMWLTERVWEPHLPRVIRRAGLEYTALDDTHFMYSGLSPEDLFGYYITEDEGQALKVFPILEPLRYSIPFRQVEKSIEFLREHATADGMRCAVVHDDGEKFGVWPETYHSVYEEGWLVDFFSALTENKDWLHSRTYSEYLDMAPARGRTYITCASYMEMGEWVLPTPMHRKLRAFKASVSLDPAKEAEAKLFLRGGFWRGFLAKYPESNNMQKKMLRVSNKIAGQTSVDDPRVPEALTLLHQGQCNCAYWHGVFGGLYLNHLRTAIYEKLIAAETLIDAVVHGSGSWVASEAVDFDGDGHPEIIMDSPKVSLVIAPQDGGTMTELDFRPKQFNFFNTLARRDEVYHDDLRKGAVEAAGGGDGHHSIHEMSRVKEAGLDQFLVYDPYRRASMRDHLYSQGITLDELTAGTALELASFPTMPYSHVLDKNVVVLTAEADINGSPGQRVRLTKRVELQTDASRLRIQYNLTNVGVERLACQFGSEWCVNLLSGTAFDRYYHSSSIDLGYAKLGERGVNDNLQHIAMRDDWGRMEIGLRFETGARVYRYALDTVSNSEGGQERIHQGCVVLPVWPIELAPGANWKQEVIVELNDTAA